VNGPAADVALSSLNAFSSKELSSHVRSTCPGRTTTAVNALGVAGGDLTPGSTITEFESTSPPGVFALTWNVYFRDGLSLV
jgi:hypothetical protein